MRRIIVPCNRAYISKGGTTVGHVPYTSPFRKLGGGGRPAVIKAVCYPAAPRTARFLGWRPPRAGGEGPEGQLMPKCRREKGRRGRACCERGAHVGKKKSGRENKNVRAGGSCRLINAPSSQLYVCTRLNREHRGWHPTTVAAARNSPSSLCLCLSLFRSCFSLCALARACTGCSARKSLSDLSIVFRTYMNSFPPRIVVVRACFVFEFTSWRISLSYLVKS